MDVNDALDVAYHPPENARTGVGVDDGVCDGLDPTPSAGARSRQRVGAGQGPYGSRVLVRRSLGRLGSRLGRGGCRTGRGVRTAVARRDRRCRGIGERRVAGGRDVDGAGHAVDGQCGAGAKQLRVIGGRVVDDLDLANGGLSREP